MGDAQDQALLPTGRRSLSERIRRNAALLPLTCHDLHGAVRAQHRGSVERASRGEGPGSDDALSSPAPGSRLPDCDRGQVLSTAGLLERRRRTSTVGLWAPDLTTTRPSMSTGGSRRLMDIPRSSLAGSRPDSFRASRPTTRRLGFSTWRHGRLTFPWRRLPSIGRHLLEPGPETPLSSSRTAPTSRPSFEAFPTHPPKGEAFAMVSFGC